MCAGFRVRVFSEVLPEQVPGVPRLIVLLLPRQPGQRTRPQSPLPAPGLPEALPRLPGPGT